MTNQEAFNTVVVALRKQGDRSTAAEHGRIVCQYRGDSGMKCAFGHLIPDEIFQPDMEGWNVGHLMDKFPALLELFTGVSLDLLMKLQYIHDAISPENWEYYFRDAATEFRLEMPREGN